MEDLRLTISCPICTMTQELEYEDEIPLNEYIHVRCSCGAEFDIMITALPK